MQKENLLMAFTDVGVVTSIWQAIPELAERYNLHIFAKDNLAYKKLAACFSADELNKYGIVSYSQMPIIEAYKITKEINPVAVVTGLSNAHKKIKLPTGEQQQEYKADFAFADAASRQGRINIGVSEAPYLSNYMIRQRMNMSRRGPEIIITASEKMQKYFKDSALMENGRVHLLPMPRYKDALEIKTSPDLPNYRSRLEQCNDIKKDDFVIVYTSSCSPKPDIEAAKILGKTVEDMPNSKVLFAFHPKDTEETRQKMLEAVTNSKELDKDGINPMMVYAALGQGKKYQIAGLRTVVLFDAVLTGSNVVSINPDNSSAMRSPTAELGLAPEVQTAEELKKVLAATAEGKTPEGMKPIPEIYTDINAPQKFASGLAKIINVEKLRYQAPSRIVPQKSNS